MSRAKNRRESPPPGGLSRRDLFKSAGAVAITGSVLGSVRKAFGEGEAVPEGLRVQGPGAVPVTLSVNGAERKVTVEPRETLLDTLRLPLDLTGAKRVCDRGSCGACTIHLDGKPVNACMILAVDAEGHAITTVEGLATQNGKALLDAFVREDAMQCGFCTPGMFMSCASAVAAKGAKLTEADARAACAGNLCRCGTYPHVLKAALAAAKAR